MNSFSIPANIGKECDTNAHGQIGRILFLEKEGSFLALVTNSLLSFLCVLIDLSTYFCLPYFGKKILSDRIYLLGLLYLIFSSVAPGTVPARTGNTSNP